MSAQALFLESPPVTLSPVESHPTTPPEPDLLSQLPVLGSPPVASPYSQQLTLGLPQPALPLPIPFPLESVQVISEEHSVASPHPQQLDLELPQLVPPPPPQKIVLESPQAPHVSSRSESVVGKERRREASVDPPIASTPIKITLLNPL